MKKLLLSFLMLTLFAMPAFADTVVYNTKTGKIHSPACQWAQKCTVNCIRIDRQAAIKRGGIPCKVCSGR